MPPKDPIKYELWRKRNSESKKGKPSPRKGKHHSEETKRLLSKINTGKKLSEETRKAISDGLKKNLFSNIPKYEEWIAKRSIALKGRSSPNKGNKYTEAIKKSMSLSHKGIKQSPEWIAKKFAWQKDPIKMERRNKKISNALKGRVMSQEWRLKNSIAQKGKITSEETRQKMRENMKTRIFPHKDTKPEKMMQIALALNGIKFEKHKPFRIGKGWHKVDLFIEPNICVEIDGTYWHIYPNAIKRDMSQTQELTLMGYHVIRIREKDILKNTQNCAEKVINLIKELHYRYPFQV